ncbi:MAG: gluconolaconase [Bryobacteraceae bacterium]|nr:gluconolaconase [Bryobacteraceae bacterium]
MAKRQTQDNDAQILQVSPPAAIPGGEFQIRGRNLGGGPVRAQVRIGELDAPVIIGSKDLVIARVPEGAPGGDLVVGDSAPWSCDIGIQIADGLHPVGNPAVDIQNNIYATFSGSRGQKTPVSVYKLDTTYSVRPFVTDLMNASGLAFDRAGTLYISSRHDGIVYESSPTGALTVFVEGMGIATGIAFDDQENLYVGDRSGTVFKISRDRQIYVFATLEASIAAYHLAFGPEGYLYTTGPTTSSFDAVWRVSPEGEVEVFYRGLGRPQGLAFDAEGRLYVAGSLAGRRGVVRIDSDRKAELFLSGPNIVGIAFTPSRSMLVATSNSLYRVDVNIAGRPIW